jgi:hypothetical protein
LLVVVVSSTTDWKCPVSEKLERRNHDFASKKPGYVKVGWMDIHIISQCMTLDWNIPLLVEYDMLYFSPVV